MNIIDFPMKKRMYSIWYAKSVGLLIHKWGIPSGSIELEELMDSISDEFKEDAEDWTASEIEDMVDSFFDDIIILRRKPTSKKDNDNDSE